MLQIITYLFLLTGIFACEDKYEPIIPPSDNTSIEEKKVLEIQWATRMDYTKEIANLASGVSYKNWFIYPGDLDNPPTLMAFNKDTGEKDWEIKINDINSKEIAFGYLDGDTYIACNKKMVFAINLESRSLIWSKNIREEEGFSLGVCTLGDNGKFYAEALSLNQERTLYEFDLVTGESSRIVSYESEGIGRKDISPPLIWNDSTAIFNYTTNSLLSPPVHNQHLKAVNINTGEEVWSTPITEVWASNMNHPPIIHNDLVITGGDWSLYAFNVHTGEQVWKRSFDYPYSLWNKTNHLIHDGRLYVNNGQHDVTCLDPNTGAIIWNNPKGGANCTDNMVYYEKEDLLVFTSWGYGSVMVLDALTGKTLHREHRYDNSSYNNDVVYDPERDMFFTSTYKHAVGFKVHRMD